MRTVNFSIRFKTTVVLMGVALNLSGCATTPPGDPWYGWNRSVHTFNTDADRFVIKPVAEAYEWITPKFINDRLTNAFDNIQDIRVTVNDLLQLKIAQGGMDFSRFLINSTLGLGGMMDVATQFDLPKHNEDFGQTLGVWGVKPGPYLVLPFFGPSSPRDFAGRIADTFFNPLTYIAFIGAGANIATGGSRVIEIADTRADAIPNEKILKEAAPSSINSQYNFIKSAYEQRREYLINDGHMPEYDLTDENEQDTPSGHRLNLSAPEPGQ